MNITSFKPDNLKVRSNVTVQIELVLDSTDKIILLTSSDARAIVDSFVELTSPTVSALIDVEVGDFATGEQFTITAHYAGEQAVCTFEIVATSIASLVIDPPVFTSGASVDLTLTLSSPSNVGGTYIRLKQLREEAFKIPLLVDLPVSILIPAGLTTETITLTAATTSLVLRDTIVAVLNGVEVGTEVSINA
jgi:hypothetical protein